MVSGTDTDAVQNFFSSQRYYALHVIRIEEKISARRVLNAVIEDRLIEIAVGNGLHWKTEK